MKVLAHFCQGKHSGQKEEEEEEKNDNVAFIRSYSFFAKYNSSKIEREKNAKLCAHFSTLRNITESL